MTRPFIGVDPGAKETGVVVRTGETIWWQSVLTGTPAEIVREVRDLWLDLLHPILAVEDLNAPNPHVGMMNPASLIGTAKVLGAILGAFPEAIVVPPGGNGSGPLSAYPEALRPTRGKGAGKDKLRHCRSAWDVSLAAERMMRVGAA